mmetsp:Transcript_45638/g.118650  ORF Transcript_45638/g.118650 Transcript_45638/m.118650 type:complete len:104 (+) Transcript_45638:50-361(+)|eukprot:CAMPEP_0203962968 /NCGR_PEP_ID=MMETSP0359-20131031/93034_1 /ASSEMBLY_ACC=CAM_ASM_000338 /TAXON_ID=268821 /ORGANISM="Scrippsiella Hangoei, Strain SHTV-5" /LENGTH=103 /DNA_ID=CAMNT_0050898559 /DNA_START=51 /DNA_END=362 /DNA_ORIENTATION=-
MAASRSTVLPLALIALAFVGALYSTGAFVNGAAPLASSSVLRGRVSQQALPVGLVEGTSVATSLQVVTAAYWANLVLVVVPVGFLIILYLQSERTKAQFATKK